MAGKSKQRRQQSRAYRVGTQFLSLPPVFAREAGASRRRRRGIFGFGAKRAQTPRVRRHTKRGR